MMHYLISTIIFLVAIVSSANAAGSMETVFKWRYFDFVWPSRTAKEQAIRNGSYDHSSVKPYDMDVSQDGRVFISFGRAPGTPVRFGVVTQYQDISGHLIQPYPDWKWFNGDSCDDTMSTIIRFKIDQCNRVWIVDSGRDNLKTRCPPKLLVFDLLTNTLLWKETIPHEIAFGLQGKESWAVTILIDTHESRCSDVTAYIADAYSHALIVWDGAKFYRLESEQFRPQPDHLNITIGSTSHLMNFGIAGMALSPETFPGETQYLFFRPMASRSLYAINTSALKNISQNRTIEILGADDILSSQSITHVFSSKGILFFGLTKELAIACWNRYTTLEKENIKIVAQDSERLNFIGGMKVIQNPASSEEKLWVIATRNLDQFQKKLNFNEFNYYVTKSSVSELIRGTLCEMPRESFNDPKN